MTEKKLTYKDAGVDISVGDAFVRKIAPMVKTTFGPEVVTGIGGFGGLFALEPGKYREPVLVSGTDGVGTKLKLAFMTGRHHTVGIDLVAMCVNDILVSGATPLFFLDYFATGKLDVGRSAAVVEGIVEGCRQARCALIGGETAEMPGFYDRGEYDLAGFAVGIVERSAIIDGSAIAPGDVVVGLGSSGCHSNGYSLVRKVVLEKLKLDLSKPAAPFKESLGQVLLEPTRIYVPTVVDLLAHHQVKGMAHITGGGLPGNLPRILPDGCSVQLLEKSWDIPPLFDFLADKGHISKEEMYRTFNMGIGFALIVSPDEVDQVRRHLKRLGEENWVIGAIGKGKGEVTLP
ncbi:MAG: phosphoribosylformylglycinamidine cyclo-ligase [bacterium]|nr:phosphoribosylformylglycinamidine cyclo-ligase [bacterium]